MSIFCKCSFRIIFQKNYVSERNNVKILIIIPGLIFIQKAFWVGLHVITGELFFGGTCYWKEFCF